MNGQINGKDAVMLGCSSYLLTDRFVRKNQIGLKNLAKPVGVRMDAQTNGRKPQITEYTEPLQITLPEASEIRTPFFVLPLQTYDAILGAPYVRDHPELLKLADLELELNSEEIPPE